MTPDDPRAGGDDDEPTPAEQLAEAERRMADADALLEIASSQLSVAARNIANANAAEREYRRATWHYTQLMKHRMTTPLQTIIGMADTLRDMPDLERSRRLTMIEAIGQQARSLKELCMTADTFADPDATTDTDLVPAASSGDPHDGDRPLPDPPNVRRFHRPSDR